MNSVKDCFKKNCFVKKFLALGQYEELKKKGTTVRGNK